MPDVGDEFEWVIQATNDGGLTWENSYLNMGRTSDCLSPDKIFYDLVNIVGENKEMFNRFDDLLKYRVFRPQTNTIYCVYPIRYLIECFEMFSILSQKEPFEILT